MTLAIISKSSAILMKTCRNRLRTHCTAKITCLPPGTMTTRSLWKPQTTHDGRHRMKHRTWRWYLVARGGACLLCTAHSWKAFREPEERDHLSPCTRLQIYRIEAE